ncbi:MAG: hypothetical protein WD845_01610 [Pirellulales bacterium]
MGWGRWLLLGDLGQQLDLHDREAQIAQLEERMRTGRNRDAAITEEVRRLTLENNELKLYLAATFRLLLEKKLIDRQELESVVRDIDLADGAADGRHTGSLLGD